MSTIVRGFSRCTLADWIDAGEAPEPIAEVRPEKARIHRADLAAYRERYELIRPYASALEGLIGDVPETSRLRATTEVLDSVDRGYTSAGEKAPRWVDALRTRLARTA